MYTKILVPLDGSRFSECVLDHVKSLNAGEIVLLLVIEPVNKQIYEVPEEFFTEYQKKSTEIARDYLEKLAAKIGQAGLSVSTAVVSGKPSEAILSYARENGIDLIAVSTHGRSGISRWALGSVADRLVRQSHIPILLISPPGCRISD
jgi:nucleotide-binding universal stress UspA family protein